VPLKTYGVLRGRLIDHRPASGSDEHFELHVVAGTTHYRVAVNVQSKLPPSELEYVIDASFRHPVLDAVSALPVGWNALERRPGGAALDYIRADLFDRDDLRTLPVDVPGPDNDLDDKLTTSVLRAIADEAATVFAFGERWPTEDGVPDPIFGFEPGNGVHDVHMNQANVGSFVADDGVHQDGALLLRFQDPAEQWVAIFLKFQSQTWRTDDTTGHVVA
jgi:uncharacterized protein YukJ